MCLRLLLPLLLGLAACSSSSGDGSSPPKTNGTVVLPPHSNAVCQDGSQPPCP
ncbi:hypothetical protein EDC31_12715 [Acidomonas methanolica]|nr:hypothetical protein EDC31_12715 [Acidomonas methanolica]